MNDADIMFLPEWDEAFDESIAQFKKQNGKEPTLVELQNLIEILINRFHALGYFIQPVEMIKK
jgi:hypothetical protein